MNGQIEYLKNENLVYAWLDIMRGKNKIPSMLFSDDENEKRDRALWLVKFILKDVLKLTEEEALNHEGILEKMGLGRLLNRPFIFIPLLNSECIWFCNTGKQYRKMFEKYIIKYAYGKDDPAKMLELYRMLYEDPCIKNIHNRKACIKKSIAFAEKHMSV